MPRRPRPSTRPPPKNSSLLSSRKALQNSKAIARKHVPTPSLEDSAEEEGGHDNFFVQGHSGYPNISGSEDDATDDDSEIEDIPEPEDEDEVDVDAPRVAQWEDDDDFDSEADMESSEEDAEDAAADQDPRLKALQNDLSSLPLGSLRKAQKALAVVEPDSDDDGASSGSEDDGSERRSVSPATRLRKEKGKEKEWSTKPRKDINKRSSKHAPTEVTSKRPVSRLREVIEVPKKQVRDPRFLALSGEFDSRRFQSQYNFLSEMHEGEVKTLRESLKHARKLLTNSPRDLRDERTAEVTRLEQALKRAESSVNRDKREKVERMAMDGAKQEEKERRKQGKGAWYMKEDEKKKILMKARYDALASEGGRSAVRKAIEKKQKKVAQKEKRSRPDFLSSKPSTSGAVYRGSGIIGRGGKRPRPSGDRTGPNKRRRFT